MLWGMGIMKNLMRRLLSSILDIMKFLSINKHATRSFIEIPKLENTFLILSFLER